MYFDIMSLLTRAITSVSGWFINIFNKAQMIPLYIAMMFIALCVRFLLIPLVGPALSDTARETIHKYSEYND